MKIQYINEKPSYNYYIIWNSFVSHFINLCLAFEKHLFILNIKIILYRLLINNLLQDKVILE